MRKLRISIAICIASISFSCEESSKQEQVIRLPYFNSPEFTPEWIEEDSENYNKIHTVSNFNLTNQHGKTITNDDITGKIYVANFFFTTCPSICPRMMDNLYKVQEAFQEDTEFAILSHTVTPWIDSVSKMKSYALHRGISARNWHLLTGDKAQIYKLARESYFADEGFGKSLTVEDDFLHTENLVLIDKKGRIRGVYTATLPVEINRLIEDIKLLHEYN